MTSEAGSTSGPAAGPAAGPATGPINGFAIRRDLVEAHENAWARIAAPGTWLSGAVRVEVAAEVRQATDCRHCVAIKSALSPYGVLGEHETRGILTRAHVELIHRVFCDPGRLTERWTQTVLARQPHDGSHGGLTEGEYVETVGIIAMVMMMDAFSLGLGLPIAPLPAAQAGEPSRYWPPGAKKQAAWLPLVEPQDTVESDGPLYPNPKAGYIYRALSLVPQTVRDYWSLANVHYLPGEFVYRFDTTIRAISRAQTEVLAARVSALHQCSY